MLPTFAQLADPTGIDPALTAGVDKNAPDARNLFRVHWFNDLAGDRVEVPDHVVLPPSLTGVEAPIIVVFGDRFPMITAHKVLAAYACLAPRVICGQFDPTHHRAIWPSTGNYARGGIAISRIMACRGVAILPAGMSQERFDWLDEWCANPAEDVIKTVGTESNVKEIYDACNELAKDPGNFVLNQFSELGNHLGHYEVTGRALGRVFEHVARRRTRACGSRRSPSATGLGRHDRRRRPAEGRVRHPDRRRRGARVPDHARERLRRAQHPGHRRQAHPADPQRDEHRRRRRHQRPGHRRARRAVQHGRRPGVPRSNRGASRPSSSPRSSTSASPRPATCSPRSRRRSCSASDPTTPSSPSPPTAARCTRASGPRRWPVGSAIRSTPSTPPRVFGEHLASVDTADMIECTERDRNRIFNLGYYTWVEQQGTPIEVFEARRSQDVLAVAAPLPRRVGRDDRRLQRPGRRVAERPRAGPRGHAPGGSAARAAHAVPIADALVVAVPQRVRARHPIMCCGWSSAAGPAAGTRRTPNPFRAFQRYLAFDAFAAANGMTETGRAGADRADRRRGRRGRRDRVPSRLRSPAPTPCPTRSGSRDAGGVWVKDETPNVGGSHKARHLFTILLHLLAAEDAGLDAVASRRRPTAARHLVVRQRRDRRGDPCRRGRLADPGVRPAVGRRRR